MNTALQLLILPLATGFVSVAARLNAPQRHLSSTRTLPPGVAISEPEQNATPASTPTSMPTTEQMTQLRFAAMAEAVRRLLGGQETLI